MGDEFNEIDYGDSDGIMPFEDPDEEDFFEGDLFGNLDEMDIPEDGDFEADTDDSEEQGLTMVEDSSTENEFMSKFIAPFELNESIEYIKDAKKAELREMNAIRSAYQQARMLKAGVEQRASVDSQAALLSLLPTMISENGFPGDLSTEQGKKEAAIHLTLSSFDRIASSGGKKEEAAKQNAMLLNAAYKQFGDSPNFFAILVQIPEGKTIYNMWLNTLSTMKQAQTAPDRPTDSPDSRWLDECIVQARQERELIREALHNQDRLTYPVNVLQEVSASGTIYKYMCGNCGSIVGTREDFASIHLMDNKTIREFKASNQIPRKLRGLGVVFHPHVCPNCQAFNIMPKKFMEGLQARIFESMRAGALISKNPNPNVFGEASVSPHLLAKLAVDIETEFPDEVSYIPQYSSDTPMIRARRISKEMVLGNLDMYKRAYLATIQVSKRSSTYSSSTNERWFGYIGWLWDRYPHLNWSLDADDIKQHIGELVLGDENIHTMCKEYQRKLMARMVGLKTLSLLEHMYTPLYRDFYVGPDFVTRGLKEMHSLYPEFAYEPNWFEGLDMNAGITSTPTSEQLCTNLRRLTADLKQDITHLHGTLEMAVSNLDFTQGVPETMIRSDLSGIPAFLMEYILDKNLVDMITYTTARMVDDSWDVGVFMRGFGFKASNEKNVEAAQVLLRGMAYTDDAEASHRIKQVASKLKQVDCEFGLAAVHAILLEGLQAVTDTQLFEDLVGIPCSHLAATEDDFRVYTPSEEEYIISRLFTINDDMAPIPGVLIHSDPESILQAVEQSLAETGLDLGEDHLLSSITAVDIEMLKFTPKPVMNALEGLAEHLEEIRNMYAVDGVDEDVEAPDEDDFDELE